MTTDSKTIALDESIPDELLSNSGKPSQEWESVASAQKLKDEKARLAFSLDIKQFRALGYQPPPFPENSPAPGRDIRIFDKRIPVHDGSEVRIRVYTPMSPVSKSPFFFNTHGGGFVVGCPESEEGQNRLVAFRNGAVVVSVEYRKAPEFPFPYAVNDSYEALLWCLANHKELGIDPERIILGGGSAGANLATVLALRARDSGVRGVIGQVLNIPVTCHPSHFPTHKYRYDSYKENADAPIVSAQRMRWFWERYLPDGSPSPEASPLLAQDLANLPPARKSPHFVLIQVAGMDPLRDEGIAYARALKNAGVETTLTLYPGYPHAFYAHPQLSASREYFNMVVDWIDKILQKN